jgi:hypothetical protein
VLSLKRRRPDQQDGAPPGREFMGTDAEIEQKIVRLTDANRRRHSVARDRELLWLRNQAGLRRVESATASPSHPEPAYDRLPDGPGLPEFTQDELSAPLLRAAILRDGCLLVRGLVSRERALAFAGLIERSFSERERFDAGRRFDPRFYEPFAHDSRMGVEVGRHWIKNGGGVLAADAPMLSFEMLEMLTAAGLPGLVAEYLGEPPLIAVHKTTLRKAVPSVAGAWHQDGRFMGEVRALNLWLSLSRCGDEAPGLDLVPRRLDHHVTTQTDEAWLDHAVSQRVAEEAAGDRPILRPTFEPGDALLFDELFLHKTGSDPSMPKPRFAIENWFFGASGFPEDYAPLAV